eukprot:sb/3475654/
MWLILRVKRTLRRKKTIRIGTRQSLTKKQWRRNHQLQMINNNLPLRNKDHIMNASVAIFLSFYLFIFLSFYNSIFQTFQHYFKQINLRIHLRGPRWVITKDAKTCKERFLASLFTGQDVGCGYP